MRTYMFVTRNSSDELCAHFYRAEAHEQLADYRCALTTLGKDPRFHAPVCIDDMGMVLEVADYDAPEIDPSAALTAQQSEDFVESAHYTAAEFCEYGSATLGVTTLVDAEETE